MTPTPTTEPHPDIQSQKMEGVMSENLKAAAKDYMKAVQALCEPAPSGKLWCELKLLGTGTAGENEEANGAFQRWVALDATGKALSIAIEDA